MALEAQLDEVMGCLAQAITSTLAMNADALSQERDAKLMRALEKLRALGEELKALGKGEIYFQLQDSVIALARGLRAGTKGPDAVKLYEATCDEAGRLLRDPLFVQQRSDEKAKRLPVLVITGFLGAGKTTLLNYILTAQHGKRIAVIENEYGQIGIDEDLVKDKFKENEEIFETNNGCICCTVRGDLIRIFAKLLEKRDKFDYVIVETTGMADPAPIAQLFFFSPFELSSLQTFFNEQSVSQSFRLDAVVTVVDTKHLLQHLDEKRHEGEENESQYDIFWVDHFPRAVIAFADRVLLNKIDLVTPEQLEAVKQRVRAINKGAPILTCEKSKVPLDDLLNLKAFDLDRILDIEPGFLQEKGTEHEHDSHISSVGLTCDEALDQDLLNAWFSRLLKENGQKIYRMKGIIDISGVENRFVFQGVHMLFDAQPGAPWQAGEARTSKLVFIGKGLKKLDLPGGFKSCVASGVSVALPTDVPVPVVIGRPAAAGAPPAAMEEKEVKASTEP